MHTDNEIEQNSILHESIMEILDNQIKNNDPPKTKEIFDRLIEQCISKKEVRRLIGCVIAAEIYDIMKNQQSFNQERYIQRLNRLPEMPWAND